MKKLLGAAALLVALAAFAVTAAAADTGGTDRPFTGTGVGAATFVPDASCPLGFRTVSEGSGTARHLGLVSVAGSHCYTPPNVTAGGRMTLVAANGDELHMTYTGTCDPANPPPPGELVTCTSDNVIVDGTGRFAHASGETHWTVLVTSAPLDTPWPLTVTWDGTLSY